MYLSSSSMPMFLQLLVASYDDPVHRNCFYVNNENLFYLKNSDNFVINEVDNLKETLIENNISFLVLDIKKWRIAHTFVVYKNDAL